MSPIDFEKYRNHRIAGKKAQAFGSLFEELFAAHCRRAGLVCTRFPDGCRQVGPQRLIRVRTPWDWILTHRGLTAFIDTKTCAEGNFNHSSILQHQVEEMYKHECAGAIAGYVIWFREKDTVIFLPVTELLQMLQVRGSVSDKHPKATFLGATRQPGGLHMAKLFERANVPVTPQEAQ